MGQASMRHIGPLELVPRVTTNASTPSVRLLSGFSQAEALHAQALAVRDVFKTYRGASKAAVAGATFAVAPGEVVGLLGPNGAGKSTTIGMITTRIPLDRGEIAVDGRSVSADPARARAKMGVTGQSNTLDSSCTARENIYLHCRYHGMSRAMARQRASDLLRTFRLTD